ncbi:30S ribosomal protein S20 [bacterium]|nr:30S ribosomal protein S20 [bacterium]
MQRHKSALKRVRTSKKRYKKNRATKATIKVAARNVGQLIDKKASAADLQKSTSKSISLIDKAAGKGIIKKNTARRKKSLIMRKVNEYSKKKSSSKKNEEVEKISSAKN